MLALTRGCMSRRLAAIRATALHREQRVGARLRWRMKRRMRLISLRDDSGLKRLRTSNGDCHHYFQPSTWRKPLGSSRADSRQVVPSCVHKAWRHYPGHQPATGEQKGKEQVCSRTSERYHIPTDEEEVEIQRQITLDPDSPEWTDEDWEQARPALEFDPELVEWSRRARGKQKARLKNSYP